MVGEGQDKIINSYQVKKALSTLGKLGKVSLRRENVLGEQSEKNS